MFFGPNVIAQVWSFSKDNDIPYLLSFDGRMKCSCPSHSQWRRRVDCKHISAFKDAAKNGTLMLNDKFTLSDLGFEFLKRSGF